MSVNHDPMLFDAAVRPAPPSLHIATTPSNTRRKASLSRNSTLEAFHLELHPLAKVTAMPEAGR